MAINRLRKLKLYNRITKIAEADQHGIFESFQGASIEENTRDKYLSEKHNTPVDRTTEALYNLAPEHADSNPNTTAAPSAPLSTRYVPGLAGVQSRRIGDGVVEDPLTGKKFDYNEGFKIGDQVYNPGDVSLQTSLTHFANHLDNIGLIKEADLVDEIISSIK